MLSMHAAYLAIFHQLHDNEYYILLDFIAELLSALAVVEG